MAQASASAQYFDPYKNFKFRVKWDGRFIAGVSRVSALRRTTEVVRYSEGSDPSAGSSRKLPGRTEYDAITLERGLTHDTEFEQWANLVARARDGGAAGDFRKDLILEVYDEAGRLALRYLVFRCWVSEYEALPDLNANGNAVAIEHIKIENEGWERDTSVGAPAAPTSSEANR